MLNGRTFATIAVIAGAYGVSFSYISAGLVQMNASATMTGLLTAAPAIGWLVGIQALPYALRKFHLNSIGLGLLFAAVLAFALMLLVKSIPAWLFLRFVFGGALGLFFRCVEYWLTYETQKETRGRDIGLYSVAFLFGIVLGAGAQPQLGASLSGLLVCLGIFLAIGSLGAWPMLAAPKPKTLQTPAKLLTIWRTVPLAFAACLCYAGFEAISSGMLYDFAIRKDMTVDIAATSLSACALGALLGSLPAGLLSDKIGRQKAFVVFGGAASLGAFFLPSLSAMAPPVYLSALVVWAATASGVYIGSLAIMGDCLEGDELLFANVGYGTIYAIGALLVPVLFGAAMDVISANALFYCAGMMFFALALWSVLSVEHAKG